MNYRSHAIGFAFTTLFMCGVALYCTTQLADEQVELHRTKIKLETARYQFKKCRQLYKMGK
jgi:hypothetical protein